MSDLIERLKGYPGASMEQLMGDLYGRSYAGLAKEAADRIAELEAENERLREAVIDMNCSCLPYAHETGEGICQRCEALAPWEQAEKDDE